MRRQDQWLLLADRLEIERPTLIAVCVFLNLRRKPAWVARELGLERLLVDRIAHAAKPLLRQTRRAEKSERVCVYCGSDAQIQKDHVIPRSRGGSDEAWNLVDACKSCNSAKGDRTPDEWLGRGWRRA